MEKQKQSENKNQEMKRPWQATVWIWLNIIGLIISLMITIYFILIPESFFTGDDFWIFAIITGLASLFFFSVVPLATIIFVPILYHIDNGYVYENFIIGVAFIFILISNIFLINKFLKRKREIIFVNITFYILGIIILLFEFFVFDKNPFIFLVIAITLIPLYFQTSCLKHPFYNQENK
ncbi:MAG: hypothetical protein KAT32_04760 [Candidatus Moranbacteria bacterium]|nr:hypothetical protein [Candidatus Moranbacteria bacterium]